jgi:3-oxoacyl-[acyl-carrier protein] reductase
VRFLAWPAAASVNSQVFIVYGPTVTLMAAPTAGHRFGPTPTRGRRPT